MSSQSLPVPSLQVVPLKVEADVNFVRKLLQKTEEGKLSWSKKEHTYTTAIPNGSVNVSLIITPNVIWGSRWSNLLAWRGSQEILRVEREVNPFAMLAGISAPPLTNAVDELAAYLEGARSREVDQATSALDRL